MSIRLSNPMCAIVWIAFLIPGRLVGGRLDLGLAFAAFAVACVTLRVMPSPWEARAPGRRAALLFAALQFLYVISYLYSLAFKGALASPRDLLELPRWLLLGGFVVYLIRHYDASVLAATESAMAAALYGSWLLFDTAGERTYVAALTLVYLIFFSRSRLRLLNAAAALIVLIFSGARPAWSASPGVLRLIRLSPVFGWGPARDEAVAGTNSQYLLWLARCGSFGAILILVGLGLAGYRLLRGEEDLRRRAKVGVFLACGALLLLSGPYLDSYRLFFVTAFMVAAVHEPKRSAA